jgi:hypothetical protein
MASLFHPHLRQLAWDEYLTGKTLMILLVGLGHTPDAADEFVDDIVADEIALAGYTREPLTSVTVTKNTGTNVVTVAADDEYVWASIAAGDVGGFYVYLDVTDDTDSILLGFYDTIDRETVGASAKVTFPAGVVFTT